MLTAPPSERLERLQRIVALQRNIILPARLVVLAVVFYMLNQSPWLTDAMHGEPDPPAPDITRGDARSAAAVTPAPGSEDPATKPRWTEFARLTSYGVMFETVENVFIGYAILVAAVAVLFTVVRRFPPGMVQWMVFIVGLGDGVFLGGLTILTGGFQSTLYWVFPAVIVLNAISIPLATPQIVLNLVLAILYLAAGLIEANAATGIEFSLSPFSLSRSTARKKYTPDDIKDLPATVAWLRTTPEPLVSNLWTSLPAEVRSNLLSGPHPKEQEDVLKNEVVSGWNRIFFPPPRYVLATSPSSSGEPAEPQTEPYVLRVTVLLLLTFCCYGVQVLAAAQERAQEEQEEFIVRTGQLRAAGRLAAEFAHQIKNPLAIINNVMYSVQKGLGDKSPDLSQQIAIVQEEVAKADLIITQIMGYARLSEGRVEKLGVVEEMERAIQQVFPPGVPTNIKVHRTYADSFPPLLMQRLHFTEAVGNLLQNARDVLVTGGNVYIEVRCLSDYSVEITVRDDGAGIPPDKLERIFEAYYTTKEKGTGLGLAIVKHNAELYGGSVRVQSELGKGAKFTLLFPAKSLIKLGR